MHSRRTFLKIAGLAAARQALGQTKVTPSAKFVNTPVLRIGYEESGGSRGFPIILLHGFPDDAHAFDDVNSLLVKSGYRTLVPYLRGYGPTRFLDPKHPHMAEQAALGQDVIDFADALGFGRFAVAGFDWGGRAAAIAAVLHPDRVRAAVLIGGYTIQNVFALPPASAPATERAIWYQYYFNTERGRAGLQENRRAICRFLWQTWSPTWHFTDETFNRTAPSFDNPEFVDIVIHSYRHRMGNSPGEPRFLDLERRLAERPKINVPVITLYGQDNGIRRPAAEAPDERTDLPALVARRVIPGAGHFLPREKPDVVSTAILEVLAASK